MLLDLIKRVKNDSRYRIRFFLIASLLGNIGYSVFLFVVSQVTASRWFFVMAVYYALLSLLRGFITSKTGKEKSFVAKVKALRACGCFLLLINAVVSAMMFLLLRGYKPIKHHEITVITIATYTFCALTVAIIGSVKFIRRKDYVYSSAKIISLVSASVSMVTLTNTMLSTWGNAQTEILRAVILPILCIVVSAFIIACAVIMTQKSTRILKNEKTRK